MRHFAVLILSTCVAISFAGVPSLAAQSTETAKAQMRFGTDMAQRGLWNEALFRFERALQLEPERAEIYNNLAVAYEALGLFDEALEHYREGLRRSPSDKGLKRNYARFVEFYQRFKPDEPASTEEAPAKAAEDEAAAENVSATTEEGSPPGSSRVDRSQQLTESPGGSAHSSRGRL